VLIREKGRFKKGKMPVGSKNLSHREEGDGERCSRRSIRYLTEIKNDQGSL
jgi:hypothetical protein